MNPSASGWINKRFQALNNQLSSSIWSEEDIYLQLRQNGFIYGTSLKTIYRNESNSLKWTEEEMTKINLFDALMLVFFNSENNHGKDFFSAATEFYELLNIKEDAFFRLPKFKSSREEYLEKILQNRIQTNESVLKRNFSHLLTNAFIFIDVLAFRAFLNGQKDVFTYALQFEAILSNTIYLALQQKEKKKHYDELLTNLFEASVRYNKFLENETHQLRDLDYTSYNNILEKRYLLDLSCLAVWDDDEIDFPEYGFLNDLGEILEMENTTVVESARFMHQFITEHVDRISYFQKSYAVKHFYSHTRNTVSLLILRNKNRLIKELMESKELMVLLGQSTIRDLSENEKQKVKTQLLDVCKSIPSLAIFLLPGGGIMLPLLVKLIPRLLPSAFNENMQEDV